MEQYIKTLQVECGWYEYPAILKCCIRNNSNVGFCNYCTANFKHRGGGYYDGFIESDDDEMLDLLVSGIKPLGGVPRKKRDKVLEEKIKKRKLTIVRRYRNKWGMYMYVIMKNSKLLMSDIADLSELGNQLNIDIEDRYLVNIDLDNDLKYMQGLAYGYPFYTLFKEDYFWT